MAMKKGLGKGVGALLGESALTMASGASEEGVLTLPLQKIEPNPLQPRKNFDPEALQTLADSIAMHGVIQPLTVRLMPSGYYQIIAGERRWRASRMAGLGEVPVVVIEADDKKAMELALIENLQRADLDPIEEALGYQQLINDYGMTQERAAERVGKSRPAVANALRLLTLGEPLQALLSEGKLSAGHARALLMLHSGEEQMAAAQKIINLQLSVRQAETMCRNMAKPAKPKPEPVLPQVDYIAECEKTLTKSLGRGVKIVHGKKKGRVELEYYGEDDLQQIYELLQSLGRKENR